MSYQPDTIKNILDNLNEKNYLPAIQREFVWKTEQIEKLFDSIMSDYPVGTFLFWKVKKDQIGQFDFYKFIKDFEVNETNNESAPTEINKKDEIIAVLDGQQRLTSLYIGLMGSYSWKGRGKTKAQQRHLYLNILYKRNEDNPDEDYKYEFRFLMPKEAEETSKCKFWFKVSEVYKPNFDVTDYQHSHNFFNLRTDIEEEKDLIRHASKNIQKLENTFSKLPIMNSYTVESPDINQVLEIFVRVNSGGVKLSYSDLLLSMATATWGKNGENNAREEVVAFLKDIKNDYAFEFDKDLIMKSWLYMPSKDSKDKDDKKVKIYASPVAFEIKNFKDAMDYIKEDWESIKKSIEASLKFISEFGYAQEFLSSAYVLLPVALHHKLHGEESFKGENKELIRKWIANALIKRVFGGKPDNILTQIRKIQYQEFNAGNKMFPLTCIAEELKGSTKDIYSSEQDVEDMLEEEYGERTRIILSQIHISTSAIGYKLDGIHQDHIYPQSWFKSEKSLRKIGFPEEDISQLLQSRDYNKLPNLALMSANQNKSKSDQNPGDYLKNVRGGEVIKSVGHMPENIPLEDIQNYKQFWSERRVLLAKYLREQILIIRPARQEETEAA